MPQHESKSERRGVSSLSAPFGYFVPLALSESPSGPVTLKAFSIEAYKASKGAVAAPAPNPQLREVAWASSGKDLVFAPWLFSSAFTVRLG